MKTPDRFEIDFDNGGAATQTTERKVAHFAEKLRVIHNPYTGNKRKMLIDLFSAMEKKWGNFDTFIDLFSGSGVVSATARHLGKYVHSNDLSPYAFLNARYFLETTDKDVLEPFDIERILSVHDQPNSGFVSKHFAERFTPTECARLDMIADNIDSHFPEGGADICFWDNRHVLAKLSILHYVMDHCFVGGRLNKGQVLADLDHRLAHQRNGGKEMSFRDINWLKPIVGGRPSYAENLDAIDFLETKINVADPTPEVCYVDPPYGGQQSDYAAMYCFFNEYILGKRQETNDHAERFVATKSYNQQFDELLQSCRFIEKLVFSYNDSSWCSIEDIVASIKRFRQDVSVQEVDYSYNYRDKANPAREFIIFAE